MVKKFLFLVLLFGFLPFCGRAQVATIDGISYERYYDDKDPYGRYFVVVRNAEDADSKYSGDIVIPETVDYWFDTFTVVGIEARAFSCSEITSITLPATLRFVGWEAFRNCEELTEIALPSNLKQIHGYAFYGCSNIQSLEIPESVMLIGAYAFDETGWMKTQTGDLVYLSNCLISYKGDRNVDRITVEDGTRIISNECLKDLKSLSVCELPESVVSIGDMAFSGCAALTEFTFPLKLKVLGSQFFYDYNGNTSITAVRYNSKEIEDYDDDCSYFFRNVSDLTIGDQVKFLPSLFAKNQVLTSFVVPENVERMDRAFNGWEKLTDVTLPSNLKHTGDGTFGGCTQLKTITLPEGLETIGYATFSECSSLSEVILPHNLKVIDLCAFENCYSLKSITIPENVEVIGDFAFDHCKSLETVNYNAVNCRLKRWPSYDVIMGVWSGDPRSGFHSKITTLNIGENVTTIPDKMFIGCPALSEVYSRNPIAPECTGYLFSISNYENATLYVPQNSLDAYREAPEWRNFLSIQNSITGIGFVKNESEAARFYNVLGQPTQPKNGKRIKRTKENSTFIIVER